MIGASTRRSAAQRVGEWWEPDAGGGAEWVRELRPEHAHHSRSVGGAGGPTVIREPGSGFRCPPSGVAASRRGRRSMRVAPRSCSFSLRPLRAEVFVLPHRSASHRRGARRAN